MRHFGDGPFLSHLPINLKYKGGLKMFGKEKIVKTLNVEGMSCMHCVKKVETALKGVKGVKSVKVNLENKTAEVTLKENVDMEVLKKAVEDAGYEVKD